MTSRSVFDIEVKNRRKHCIYREIRELLMNLAWSEKTAFRKKRSAEKEGKIEGM